MNIISSILILIAVVLSFVTLLALFAWLRGGGSVLFPGLGLIFSTPAIIVLLLILNIAVVVAAAITKPRKEFVNETNFEQKFKYPK